MEVKILKSIETDPEGKYDDLKLHFGRVKLVGLGKSRPTHHQLVGIKVYAVSLILGNLPRGGFPTSKGAPLFFANGAEADTTTGTISIRRVLESIFQT